MNTDQLRAFCTAVKTGSISRAARDLHLTQPALSQQIQALEAQFGVELLKRNHRGVEPTAAGKAVFESGQRMLTLAGNLKEEVARIAGSTSQRLAVGASSGIGGYALPCSVYLFKEKYPEADIRLMVANTAEILERLEDREISVGLVEGPVEPRPELVATPLSVDELVLIVPPGGTWEGKTEISLEELRQQPLLVREDGSGTRHTLEAALASAGLGLKDFRITMELNSLDAIKASVEAGRGVSLVCRMAIRKELRHGSLRSLSLQGLSFPHYCTMLHPRIGSRTPLESRFIRFMRSSRERDFC